MAAAPTVCNVDYTALHDSNAASNDVILEGTVSVTSAGEAIFGALTVKGVVGLPIPVSLRCGDLSVAAVFHIGPCAQAFEMSRDRCAWCFVVALCFCFYMEMPTYLHHPLAFHSMH